jgi:hypothetical protein
VANALRPLVAPPRRLLLAVSAGETWNELCRSGTYYALEQDETGHLRREVIPTQAIDDVVATFPLTQAQGWYPLGTPVTANHGDAYCDLSAETTRAYARIVAVRAEDNETGGRSLYGLIRWGETGADYARDGAFATFSAELDPPGLAHNRLTGEPLDRWVLVGCTLTNRPFVPGMAPVVAPDDDIQPQPIAASERRGAALYLADERPPAMPEITAPADLMAAIRAVLDSPSAESVTALKAVLGPMKDDQLATYMAGFAAAKAALQPSAPEIAPVVAADPVVDPVADVGMKCPACGADCKPGEPCPSCGAMVPADAAAVASADPAVENEQPKALADVRRQVGDLARRVKLLTDTVGTVTRERDSYRRRLDDQTEANWKQRLDDAVKAGRITPAERGEYRKVLEATSEEFARKVFHDGRTGVGKVVGYSGADAVSRGTVDLADLATERASKMPGGLCASNYNLASIQIAKEHR